MDVTVKYSTAMYGVDVYCRERDSEAKCVIEMRGKNTYITNPKVLCDCGPVCMCIGCAIVLMYC